MPQHPFALAALHEWIDDLPVELPVPLLDLFCWEQMAGRWQAMIRAEFDVVQESFAPLNSRALLLDMLSVDESQRCQPDCRFLAELIGRLWPGTLEQPVNPPERESMAYRLVRAATRLKLHRLMPGGLRGKLRVLATRT